MEIGVLIVVLLGIFLGFLVLQGTFAAQAWRERIAAGDLDVLRQALDAAFEVWREMRPPKGMPAADWAALASPELIAADRDRARVSLVADADVRVVDGERRELAGPLLVGRRVALRMAERLLYEIPHVRFAAVQVDVWERYRDAAGVTITRAILTTRATREQAADVDWAVRWELESPPASTDSTADADADADVDVDVTREGTDAPGDAAAVAAAEARARDFDPAAVLAQWRTREAPAALGPDGALDPDHDALILAGEGIDFGAANEEHGSGAEAEGQRPVARAGTHGGASQ